MTTPYTFRVTAAGSPRDCNSAHRRHNPVILLSGGPHAHAGVVMGVRCRLVAAPDSPLKFTGIGEVLPRGRKDVAEAEREGARWVVLEPFSLSDPWPKELFAMQVKIEYDPDDLAAAEANLRGYK